MQHSLRDPNRDHTHGRIWRITYPRGRSSKGQDRRCARSRTARSPQSLRGPDPLPGPSRAARAPGPGGALRPNSKWVAGLDNERRRILAADARGPLGPPEPRRRGRRAAQDDADVPRTQGPSRGNPRPLLLAGPVKNPIELLQKQVNDEHPRVRLEAVRALSFFEGDQAAKAQEIAMESLVLPQDYYLEYTLNETTKTLDQRIKTQSKSK